MTHKNSWTEWANECRRFAQRETEGFTKDLQALEAHIKKLTELCPKDKAGWPTSPALRIIDELTTDYNAIKKYLDLTTS